MSLASAGSGEIETVLIEGGELPTTAVAETGLPLSMPSWGVTVQVTTSPSASEPVGELPDPAEVLLTSQARVEASASPSASE